MYQSAIEIWKISDLERDREVVNANPVHQRPQRGKSNNNTLKSEGIIESLMAGVRSMITVCRVDDGSYEYESIDGGHRKRAILGYLNGDFAVNGKLFRQLSAEERKAFRDIELTVCVYENVAGPEIGNIFRSLNRTDRVSPQENLNSYGDTPIANAIRSTVRQVDGYDTPIHPLFNYSVSSKKNNLIYTYVGFNNEQLAQEQWVARLYYYFLNGDKISTCGEKELEAMYDSDPDQTTVNVAKAKVDEVLNYVERQANYRLQDVGSSAKISDKIANLFIRIRFQIMDQYGKMPQFSKKIGFTERDFHHKVMEIFNEVASKTDTFEWSGFKSDEESQSIGYKVKATLSQYDNDMDRSTLFSTNVVLSQINLEDYLLIKDKKRSASKEVRERLLYKQNFIDPATGKRINLDNSQADHIIPHAVGIAAGGVTEDHNLQMVTSEYNQGKSDTILEKVAE